MARNKKNNPLVGLIIGPVLVGLSVMVLWQNEHRFDYHKAARQTVAVTEVAALQPEQVFSYTGSMDKDLTLEGRYVDSFKGYLTIRSRAEIYAWHEDEDDEGHVEWRMQWMSRLESNERNQGITKQLSSNTYLPAAFYVSDLTINTKQLGFVDRFESIAPSSLRLSAVGQESGLETDEDYFYLNKGKEDQLGDERISYRGLPVPAVATYFGKYGNEEAIAHEVVTREGLVSAIIQDTGLLHHLVAGERDGALFTMKAHLQRVKMIVRAVGTAANCFGWMIFFSVFTRLLIHVPLVGPLLQGGVALLGLVLGLVVSVLTIVAGFLTHQPWILLAIALGAGSLIVLLRRNARRSQNAQRSSLEAQLGETLTPERVKELEFIELVRLAEVDDQSNVEEAKYLRNWATHHGWDEAKIEHLLQRAKLDSSAGPAPGDSRSHLLQLIQLAMADGDLDEKEMKTIRKAARDVGCKRGELSRLIGQAQHA